MLCPLDARPWALAVLSASAISTASAAQELRSPDREGFWASVSAGPAWATLDCGRCETLPDSIPYAGGPGFSGSVVLGWAVSPRVLVGGGISLYGRRRGNRDATVGVLAPVARVHPFPARDVFVNAGVGIGWASLAGGGTLIEASGVGVELGIGGDMRWLGLVLSPQVGVMASLNTGGSASVSGTNPGADPPRRPRLMRLGLGVSWY